MMCPSCNLDGLQVRILRETWAEPVEITLDNTAIMDGEETETSFTLICLSCGFEFKLDGAEEA